MNQAQPTPRLRETQAPAPSHRWLPALLSCVLLGAMTGTGGLRAQEKAPASVSATPADLAKYDKNKDGVLEADELAAKQKAEDKLAKQTVTETRHDDEQEAVVMDPFTVQGDKDGYYGSNAMSGTRLNSKVEDLASAVTVVTLDEMNDFAMLDINDIFSYQAGAEGLNEYTDFSVETSGNYNDNSMASPTSANRIRGVGAANVSMGNFETSGRVPIDKVGIDGVEITRGPNSSIFGLGNPSGTVNVIAATGSLNKNKTRVEVRADSFGGYRESLDINRVILKNKLAFRVSEVLMHTGYPQKPSGTNTARYNFMVKYQPFPKTTITASYLDYRYSGIRTNTLLPRDSVSSWIAAGQPTWDPVTAKAYAMDGTTVISNNGKIPSYFTSAYQQTGRGSALLFVDGGTVNYWTAPRGTATGTPLGIPIPIGSSTNPAVWDANVKASQASYNYVFPTFGALGSTQPLLKGTLAYSGYDWKRINLAAINKEFNRTGQSMVQLTQTIFDTPENLLALQAGWFREDSKLSQNFPYGKPYGYYMVDVNRRRLDGSPNPNFLRPFISIPDVSYTERPLTNDTFRGQLAYKFDMSREKGWKHWIGIHQLSAYTEYKHFITRRYTYKPAMLDDHAWLPAGVNRATSTASGGIYGPELYNQNSPTGTRNYAMYYVGDATGNDIDYAPTPYSPGTYGYTFGNAATGAFTTEPTQLGFAGSLDATGGINNILKVQKTYGAVLQSHVVNDSIIPTIGLRHDKIYNQNGFSPRMMPDGKTPDYTWDERWDGDWTVDSGTTSTQGVVVRPLTWLAGTRVDKFIKNQTWFSGISFYGNRSDSFLPADPAIDLHGHVVSNPSGKGQDYGFWLNLFDSKFNVRVNRFQNQVFGSRTGVSSTIANRVLGIDFYDGNASRDFALNNRATQWITAQNPGITSDQLLTQLSQTMHLTPGFVSLMTALQASDEVVTEPEDTLSRGYEIEANYNPTHFLTFKANLTEMRTIQATIAPGLLQYIDERMPYWTSIVDPTLAPTAANPNSLWWLNQYAGPTAFSPKSYFDGTNVSAPLTVAKAQQGLSLPTVRRYTAKLASNLQLSGLTDHPILKAFNVGGGVRWGSPVGIGYYGIKDANGIYTALDRNRPIYAPSTIAVDLNIGYTTKVFFSKKTGVKLQLNIKNVAESGRLLPINAWPDGTITAYRIADPQQILLTATFDL